MNILPLILALVLMLSVLTVEKLEKMKNQVAIQKEYQVFLKWGERQVFNKRQEILYDKKGGKDIKQLSFRFIIDKKARETDENVTKQYRLLNLELMKILYGEAAFFKNLQQRRPNFLEEMIAAIEKAVDAAPKKFIKRIEDIARLKLEDPELQEAFYHMLKGTISREHLRELKKDDNTIGKAYVSLFSFINYKGSEGEVKKAIIEVQHAPREILKAIFANDDIVEAIITKRNELAKSKDNGASTAFKNEFSPKRRPGIDDTLLDFKITAGGDTTEYD